MNYIRGAYQYYKELPPLNAATLTGAIDVIVIEKPTSEGGTELACTPFHVRFGKLQILRPGEKQVIVVVNGEHVPFPMKIGIAGEAFFVCETDEDVPEELMTSPLLRPSSPELGQEPQTGRFGAKEEGLPPRDVVVGKEAPPLPSEMPFLDLNATSAAPTASSPSFPSTSPPSTPHSRGSPATTLPTSASPSPPMAAQSTPPSLSGIPRAELAKAMLEGAPETMPAEAAAIVGPLEAIQGPDVTYRHDIVLDMEGYHANPDEVNLKEEEAVESESEGDKSIVQRVMGAVGLGGDTKSADGDAGTKEGEEDKSTSKPSSKPQSPVSGRSRPRRDRVQTLTLDSSASSNSPYPFGPARSEETLVPSPIERKRARSFSSTPTINLDTPAPVPVEEYSWEWGAMPTPRTQLASEAEIEDERRMAVGAKIFPIGQDGTSFGLEVDGKRATFQLSLCGPEAVRGHDSEIADAQAFTAKRVTYKEFVESSTIAEDPNLVLRWNDKYITRLDASPLFPALAQWRLEAAPHDLNTADLDPPPGPGPTPSLNKASSWSRWWTRSRVQEEMPLKRGNSGPPVTTAPAAPPAEPEPGKENEPVPTKPKTYAKTLRLTSDQLKALNLKSGANTITFSLASSKAVVCTARIFLWQSTDHIVVSDIDGTITKSDALGHVFTMIGRDWTHSGVAKLYTDICRNGYKIMYLTSRAIGQADSTRDYLKGINQTGYQLPEGPVIMSPDRLMASLHREVIMRKPEVFKMACLRDIQRLFGDQQRHPFYAGFGNRITDALSYRSVNIPSGRIFTIDSSGEVKMELLELAGYKSSYIHMTDLVDQMFPPVHRKWTPEFTDFNYWRTPMVNVELPDLRPPSPALSARSDSSSRLSRIRQFTLGLPSTTKSSKPSDGLLGEPRQPRPTSPLMGPSITADSHFDDDRDFQLSRSATDSHSMPGSLPGSPDDRGSYMRRMSEDDGEDYDLEEGNRGDDQSDADGFEPQGDYAFDDDLLATGEMENVPFL